jgi:ABC-type transport system involved in multi-copper enzyme maturation permease subunit
MSDDTAHVSVPYRRYLAASFVHAMTMTLRRKRVLLAAALVLGPVLIPLALAFLSTAAFAEEGNRVFVRLVEHLYLDAIAPLLALFFGCMLIGEDVESQTIPYLLTRPLPRSTIVVGRFFAYLIIAGCIMLVGIAMTFAACTALGNLSFMTSTVTTLVHYEALAFLALLSYGAFALCLGALTRHPVIIGILFIFGWQKLVAYIPGLVDFLTIQKYIDALLPALATERQNEVIKMALVEYEKQQLLIDAPKALGALLAISVGFVIVTCLVVRWREYSAARAVGG